MSGIDCHTQEENHSTLLFANETQEFALRNASFKVEFSEDSSDPDRSDANPPSAEYAYGGASPDEAKIREENRRCRAKGDKITVSFNNNQSLGQIILENIDPDYTGDLISSLDCASFPETCIDVAELKTFLKLARLHRAQLSSSLDLSEAEIFNRYQNGEVADCTNKPSKAKITFLPIHRSKLVETKNSMPSQEIMPAINAPLTWINVELPNEQVLRNISKAYSINYDDLLCCLKVGQPPTSYRYARYLVNRFDELSLDQAANTIRANTICAILGDNYLITICTKKSEAVVRVWNEVHQKEVPLEEICSSNYIFSRLLGSALHINEEVIKKFDDCCKLFAQELDNKLPGEEELRAMNVLTQSISDALHSSQGGEALISALGEERNLFGAITARDALGRYRGMLEGIVRKLDLVQNSLGQLRESWQTQGDQWRNDILFKIAILSGSVSIPSLICSFFGMSFNSFPLADEYIWGGVVLSMVTAAAMVWKLMRSKNDFEQSSRAS